MNSELASLPHSPMSLLKARLNFLVIWSLLLKTSLTLRGKWVLFAGLIFLVFPLLLNLGLEVSQDLERIPVPSKRFLFFGLSFLLFFKNILFGFCSYSQRKWWLKTAHCPSTRYTFKWRKKAQAIFSQKNFLRQTV